MDRGRKALRSKVARRLVLMFFLCALLPTGALALLSFQQVTAQLYEQSQQRLHRASKAAAMVLMGRMRAFDADLASLAREPGAGAPARPDAISEVVRERFVGVAVERGGRRDVLFGRLDGPAEPPPAPSPAGTAQTRLTVVRAGDGAPRLVFRRRVGLPGGDAAVVTGETTPSRLFDESVENSLPPLSEYCVLDDRGLVVHCSDLGAAPALPAAWSGLERQESVSGWFDWDRGDAEFVAGYWSLFLKARFGTPAWTFVVSEPRTAVLAPIASFQTLFPLVVLFSLGFVSLLSISQVRRRLIPLEILKQQTGRIAGGDFGATVEVASGDEFEELAASFNVMSGRLEEQFADLRRLIDVDREVLSTIDAKAIIDALLSHIRDVYPCEAVTVGLRDPDSESGWRFHVADDRGDPRRQRPLLGPSPAEIQQLARASESLRLSLAASAPSYLEELRRAGARLAVVLPLFVARELVGVVALGHRDPDGGDPRRLVYARQVADQAAVALANAWAIERNRELAYYDSLTGLPNRLLFKERLEQALLEARRSDRNVAACLLDLDGFKRINDTFGHESGDELLRQVAARLQATLRQGSVARLGGDEFTIVITNLESPERAARVAGNALAALGQPFTLGEREVFVTASVGIATFPADGRDLETLVKNADAAMYHAKSRGRNNYQFYTRSLNEAAMRRMDLESDLRHALSVGEFRIHFQPVVDVETREPVGAEALLRWPHPRHGFVSPAEFIPVAEEIGLIQPLGEWVLRRACELNHGWQRSGLPPIRVAVNLSSAQFGMGDLVGTVRRALLDSHLNSHYLGLEITESILMHPDDETLRTMREIKAMGVQLSIDDFGTGYSSLSYLKSFPVDALKIDQSFVRDLGRSPEDEAITRTIVVIAHSLGVRAVAEGVETEAQLAFLREHGCDAAQGYLFAKPLSQTDFEKYLREWADRPSAGAR